MEWQSKVEDLGPRPSIRQQGRKQELWKKIVLFLFGVLGALHLL
jgi:hypothetical protein